MGNLIKLIVTAIVGVIVGLLISTMLGAGGDLGGLVHYNQEEFKGGIKAGSANQFVIDSTGSMTAVGSITTTGAVTATGAVTGSTVGGGILGIASSTSAADTLTAAQSGQTIVITTTGAGYTLPAVTNTGAHYRFYVGGNFTTNAVITSAEGDNISGGLQVNSLPILCVDEDFITFVADGEIVGDYVELTSIGTGWLITGSNGVASAKITCTDPS